MKIDGPQRLGFLLNDATRLLRKRFKARATRFGLSMAQWRLLFRLMREEGVPQARLAELLEIEPISVSRLLDRMEEAGWIVRRACETDRRVRMVYPTDKTRRTYAEIRGIGDELYGEAMAGLSDAERLALLEALRTVVENLSGEEVDFGGALAATGGDGR